MIMEKAVCTLGLKALPYQKIKSKDYHFFVCRTFDNYVGVFLLQRLNWIEGYSTTKIGRFFFCLSIFNTPGRMGL